MPDRPEIYNMAGHLIRRLHQISVAVFADHMAREGVELTPVQFAALSAIRAQPGIDQATLAGAIAYDKATLGGVIDRLEGKGLIVRTVSPQDRRARVLGLTEEGQALFARMVPVVRTLQTDILSGLNEDERETLLALLKKTTEAGNEKSRAPLRPVKARGQG
ncbi:MAG: MarR family transcriptional regulator [Roseivivax sp.]|nr:MarR family transcriptional regulator [Roseivivax sp.]